MNKADMMALVAQLARDLDQPPMEIQPKVKGSTYYPSDPGPEAKDFHHRDGDFVEDVSELDLRKLYMTDSPQNRANFAILKEKTPARLGSGKAGPRYKTLTMLRFRADHAAAQDSVFSQLPEDFGEKNGMVSVQTMCHDKDEYLTRPDLGRKFDADNQAILARELAKGARVQIVVGDGLSSAAIATNAMPCVRAISKGLQARGMETGKIPFVRYCRVGAGDAVGDITDCDLVCVLVGERPGLVTDKSMSAYITYKPHTGVSESARTVVSNIHSQGIPAQEAGEQIAGLIETILRRKVSGVGLHLEEHK